MTMTNIDLCTGKVRFASFRHASKAASRKPHRKPYRCEGCGQYHVGGTPHKPRKFKKPGPRRIW